MRKKIKARLVCLIVAGVMLVGAVTVAAIEGSPYETLKRAALTALTNENFTVQGEMTISLNGEVYETQRIHYVQTETCFADLARVRRAVEDGFFFSTENLEIYPVLQMTELWYAARTTRGNHFRGAGLLSAEELDTARFRFMELMIDLMVGDLKNNMFMSSSDGVRRVSGAISHSQLPEIVRLGIYMAIEENLRWYDEDFGVREDFRHPMDIPVQNVTVNRISGNADIDAEGNLLYISVYANITTMDVFGGSNVIQLSAVLNFSDIGTSVVESPIEGAVELFTSEFMYERFGRRYITVYFTRNADGSVNRESITTTWPAQLYMPEEEMHLYALPPRW